MRKLTPKKPSFIDKAKKKIDSFFSSRRRAKNTRVYSNLSSRRDQKARKKAEHLSRLPKSPIKRFFYRLNPKNFFRYWFSKRGLITSLKIAGVAFMLLLVVFVSVFAYFRKDLDKLNPAELNKRVHSSTTKYYDRSGKVLLWEDKGIENRTVVASEDISTNMKQATVALEDKDFYQHSGFSPSGIIRAGWTNVTGGTVQQGGSTLTQQLIKNVLLTNEVSVSRKIKELILSIEVERLYTKDQILTMYLNEVSYGGNRNGVEAASKEYFGKSAKDLTLDESALLAAIPQRPPQYDPWSETADFSGLIDRQHSAIDKMAKQGYITVEEAEKAKKIDTLDKVLPPAGKYKDMIAPHFVLEVQKQLQDEFGAKLVTTGGLKVITTLDVDMQNEAEIAVAENMAPVEAQNGNNAAMVAVENETGQILAYQGSRDFNYPGYGSYNAANALLQPGSSIKPFDYAELFKENIQPGYTPGSTLSDQPLDINGYSPKNFDKGYRGSISIRQALGESRNIPAVKAAYAAGMDNVINLARDMGDKSYCTVDSSGYCGLAAAIGGYSLRLDEHTNAYASFARGGAYKDLTYVLKVEAPNGDMLKEWKNPEGKQVLDPQIAYMITDILADFNARVATFGGALSQVGFNPDGVKVAVKTGTTDEAKDGWMMGYSPKITLGVWVGRSDGQAMNSTTHLQTGPMFGQFMERAHKNFGDRYGWSPDTWFDRPEGIQDAVVDGRRDIVPSWHDKNKPQGLTIAMDKVSKKKATDCTPDAAKEEITVYERIDIVTKQKTLTGAPAGYDLNADDDVHKCDDKYPSVSISANSSEGVITVSVKKGTHTLDRLTVMVDGNEIASRGVSGSGTHKINHKFNSDSGQVTISANVKDKALYDAANSQTINIVKVNNNSSSGSSGNRRSSFIPEFSFD